MQPERQWMRELGRIGYIKKLEGLRHGGKEAFCTLNL
jgi:hypothetical protein